MALRADCAAQFSDLRLSPLAQRVGAGCGDEFSCFLHGDGREAPDLSSEAIDLLIGATCWVQPASNLRLYPFYHVTTLR
eukprot:7284788-Pyramimonas_sp.AAC.1